jgi:outer membrane protein assembly factor BamD
MILFNKKAVIASLAVILAFSAQTFAQAKPGDGSPAQRLDVLRQKLETIRRSATSAASVLKQEAEGDKAEKDSEKRDTPVARLKTIEKEASSLQSDVNSLRGKIDRSEKYEASEIDQLETAVADLQSRADAVQVETAQARAATDSPVGKSRDVKKKKKFLGIFGGDGNDEYDQLIGTVSPGRDRELFIVATREVRKKNFDVGRLLFQTIITTYPDSPYLPMSKLAVADSFFLEGTTSALIQAIAAYQDWLTFFPTHPLADRVVLKIAEAEMRQIGLPDRDATHAKRAEIKLKALLQNSGSSVLKKDAEERLGQVQDNLGLHSLFIANYYYNLSVDQKKGGLKGAQSRYREILDKYPGFCFMDEALFRLAVTYQLEEETDQAARYFQKIVSDYPNSEYVDKAKEQLGLIGASVPAVNPERASVVACAEPGFFQNFKNQLFGIYPMTIDKNGVLMTKDFDKEKFELIDQIIENQGDILTNQIPQALTTVISQRQPPAQSAPAARPQQDK